MQVIAQLVRGELTLLPTAKIKKAQEAASHLFVENSPWGSVIIDKTLDWKSVLQTTQQNQYNHYYFDKMIASTEGLVAEDSVSMKPRSLKNKFDTEVIVRNLPEGYEFSLATLCQSIATDLNWVIKGRDSQIFAKGSWYIFYTSDFVVTVRWSFNGASGCEVRVDNRTNPHQYPVNWIVYSPN